MTATTIYATLDEAKQWIGLSDTEDDAQIVTQLETVSRWIDQHCVRYGHRFFGQTAAGVSRTFDTRDSYCLNIDEAVAVTAVATDSNADGTYETTWAASDYELRPVPPSGGPELRPYTRIVAIAGKLFPMRTTHRSQLVRVTGTWGWAAVPSAVHTACLMQTSRLLQRRKSPEGVAGWGEFGPLRVSARLDPDVVQLLDGAYRYVLVA